MVPLLFNINMIDLFYECKENDIPKYAENTASYLCAKDIATKVFNWFEII